MTLKYFRTTLDTFYRSYTTLICTLHYTIPSPMHECRKRLPRWKKSVQFITHIHIHTFVLLLVFLFLSSCFSTSCSLHFVSQIAEKKTTILHIFEIGWVTTMLIVRKWSINGDRKIVTFTDNFQNYYYCVVQYTYAVLKIVNGSLLFWTLFLLLSVFVGIVSTAVVALHRYWQEVGWTA